MIKTIKLRYITLDNDILPNSCCPETFLFLTFDIYTFRISKCLTHLESISSNLVFLKDFPVTVVHTTTCKRSEQRMMSIRVTRDLKRDTFPPFSIGGIFWFRVLIGSLWYNFPPFSLLWLRCGVRLTTVIRKSHHLYPCVKWEAMN